MLPWKNIDQTQLPDDGGTLSLHKRGDEFTIRVDGVDLMNSLAHESEDVLGKLTCANVADRPKPSVLIGGLGMGFTLAAALRHLSPDAKVTVAELVPAVVKWNREHLGELAGHPLKDKRVTVRECDIAEILKNARQSFDAIILDVDNGPEGLTHKANDWLYSRKGLAASQAALHPNGILAVWSVSPDEAFTKRLTSAGFKVEIEVVRSKNRHGTARHTIWLGKKSVPGA